MTDIYTRGKVSVTRADAGKYLHVLYTQEKCCNGTPTDKSSQFGGNWIVSISSSSISAIGFEIQLQKSSLMTWKGNEIATALGSTP